MLNFLIAILFIISQTLNGNYFAMNNQSKVNDVQITPEPSPTATAIPTDIPKKNFRFISLGDSYTIGQSINSNSAWPNLLVSDLSNNGINIQLIANPSRTGFTTQDLLNKEYPVFKQLKPDFITVLIGVNDWVQGVSPEQFKKNLVFIFDSTQAELASKKNILVVTIPDFSVTPTGKQFGDASRNSKGIEQFNTIIKKEAGKRGLRVVDIFSLSQEMGKDPELVSVDGLHPSEKEYEKWEKLIYPEAYKILSEQKTP